ncbi:MAG TPA: HAD family phosphatase [Candidatus Saccharimonadales bacterium]
MDIKGFFFDLDGTLVDTHESNFRAYKKAIEDIKGIGLGEELKDYIKAGESSAAFLPRLLPKATHDEIRAINQRKKQHYPEQLHLSQLNKRLFAFLEQMSEHYITVLVTTAKKSNGLAVLRAHNLEQYFKTTVFGEEVSAMKPSPEAYLVALEKTGLKASEVIAFEDSKRGLDAARAAGIKTVHVRNFL